MKFRISVENEVGDIYSWIEEAEEEYIPEIGEWIAPFPNEKGNSFAFGVVESFLQSDNCSTGFLEYNIIKVICSKIE